MPSRSLFLCSCDWPVRKGEIAGRSLLSAAKRFPQSVPPGETECVTTHTIKMSL